MKCSQCQRDLPPGLRACPACAGKPSRTKVATKERFPLDSFPSGLKERSDQTAGLREQPQGGSSQAGSDRPPQSTSAPPLEDTRTSAVRWTPSKQQVELWATARQLNHYEVLALGSEATAGEIAERVNILDERLEQWSLNPHDSNLQRIGMDGKQRLYELREAFTPAHRQAYDQQIAEERHQRALTAMRERVRECIEKDQVLQWNEWLGLETSARENGVSEEELEEILARFREGGTLTGLLIGAGREIRTLIELKNRCLGHGEPLIEALWDGRLEEWLEKAAVKQELAAEVRQIRTEYAEAQLSGAYLFLWRIGEKRLALQGNAGIEEIESVAQLKDACERRGAMDAATAALADRRLENWLRHAINQEHLSAVAARLRTQGASGVREIFKQLEAHERRSFKFKADEAHTIPELIRLCDQFPQEAEQFFFKGWLENWLATEQGNGALALQANELMVSYKDRRRQGLELFVRELCLATGVDAYPVLVAEPDVLNFGQLPMGKQAEASIQLLNLGRGYAWGTVAITPELPGLRVTETFHSDDNWVYLQLNTLHTPPGDYAGVITISAEGLPTSCQVPISFTVVPLQVQITPSLLDFGNILRGKQSSLPLQVTYSPPDGLLVGSLSLSPPLAGISTSGELKGAVSSFDLAVDTTPLEPGRRYATNLQLDTNAGSFAVPLYVHVGLRWDLVAAWTVGLAIAIGAGMSIVRFMLASADFNLAPWFLSYGNAPIQVLIPTGFLGLFMLLPLIIKLVPKFRKRKAST